MSFRSLLARFQSQGRNPSSRQRKRRSKFESLERRELLALVISEVHPSGSGNGAYSADWFEVSNTGQSDVDISGWRMDDSSNAFTTSVALRGVTIIPAGKSAVFFEGTGTGSTDATITAAFSTAWFGSPTLPAGFLIGAYGGSGVGLGTSGDAVNLFDGSGAFKTGVSFGAATASRTFDNTGAAATISALSTTGINGGFVAANGVETGSPGRTITDVDLSTYVRVGRFDLPEPTRTPAPPGGLLAQEASAVTYNWDTDTLFITGDGGKSIVQVSKTGQLIDSMTMADGGSPQGTEFYDPEGLTYVGNGTFVMTEERDRQAVLFTYAAGTTLQRADTQTVKLGTFVPNTGLEGLTYDPLTGGFIFVKEIDPQGIFQSNIDFAAGTATNGSPTTVNSVNLFNPALAGMLDFADVFAMSNLSTLNGDAASGRLLVLSQESGNIVHIDRAGNILSTLTIVSDPGNPLSVSAQQHEGLTMDGNGYIYVVSENGGGDFDHPQLWVYAPSSTPNQAPTAVTLDNQVAAIFENSTTVTRTKVADVVVADDGLGVNQLSVVGADAASFDVDGTGLYLKAGVNLDFETKSSYTVAVTVNDPSTANTPDATSADYTLSVTDIVNEDPSVAVLFISEVAPWSSGNSPLGADWFEVTNNGNSPVNLAGWKMDDGSASFAAAVSLNGITSIAPGESVIFIETNDLVNKAALFRSTWFGANPPANLQIGSYSGSGVGLSTGGDAVNLYNSAGMAQAGVTFGASPTGPYATFDNAAGINNDAATALSKVRVHGAFAAVNNASEVGSPGSVGRLFISEIAPWSSGNSPIGVDWFELTNSTAHPIDLTGWKMDDSSESFAASVALSGITSIAPGESVIFLETNDLATKAALFRSTWFGDFAPDELQIGSYSGGGVGLSTGGDAVAIYNAAGLLRAKVSFGPSPTGTFATFDNATALNNTGVTRLSQLGVDGVFAAAGDALELGSPGTIYNRFPLAVNEMVTTPEDAAVTFAVLPNDTDPDGDALQIVSFTSPSHGDLVQNEDGTFTYTPDLNFSGTDSFTYTITDGRGPRATATVSIKVLSPAEQLAEMQFLVESLADDQATINKGQANSLLMKIAHVQTSITQVKAKVAYNGLGAFTNHVESLIQDRVLTAAEGAPLLSIASALRQSLLSGGGF